MAVEVEQGLCTGISLNQVRQIEQSIEIGANDTLGISQQQIRIRVGIGADVCLEIAPRNRRQRDAHVGDDAVVLGVDLILGDVEVRIIHFGPRGQGGNTGERRIDGRDPAPGTGWSQEVLRIVGLRPRHQPHQRTDFALVDLIVVGIRVAHRQIGVQPRIDLRLRSAGHIYATIVGAGNDSLLPVE